MIKSAEEYLEEYGSSFTVEVAHNQQEIAILKENALEAMHAYAKEYALACLENQAKNARVKMVDTSKVKPDGLYMYRDGYAYFVDKDSIKAADNLL